MPNAEYLDVAHRIGHRLARSAIRSGSGCTWRITTTDPERPAANRLIQKIAGGLVYQGSAGIALFLTELFRLTGDVGIRATAAAALHHALGDAKRAIGTCGFYSGYLGIAHAAGRFATVTGDEECRVRARDIARPLHGRAKDVGVFDVIGGAAGAIPTLLRLSKECDRPDELHTAVALGDHLIQTAQREVRGWSWGGGTLANVRNLTGLAHGAAGAGYALVELYAATGERDYWVAAEQAFEYERYCFSDRRQNWPDYRHGSMWKWTRTPAQIEELREALASGQGPRPYVPECMVAWCHGAVGIGMTRLRAYAITGDLTCRGEASTAVETTKALLERGNHENYSLCHGVLGNCELLLDATAAGFDPELAQVARAVADGAMERHELAGVPWPGGVIGGGDDPSLMLGDAGIGYFYLRLADPTVPSVLLVTGGSDAPPTTRERPSSELRDAHIDTYFAGTRRSLSRLTGTRFAVPNQTASPVLEAVAAVGKAIAHASADARPQLADAARVDLARYELSSAPLDCTAELLDELRWRTAAATDWESGVFTLGPLTRLVETRYDWTAWADELAPPERSATIVLSRHMGLVREWRVGEFAAEVFRSLESPRTIDEIVDLLGVDAGPDATERDVWKEKVAAQLRAACDAAVVVCDLSCEGAPVAC